ncbi:CDP-glucose 4,6-dehydratase [Streptomyces sp. NPDC060184]|uniref:CDP-glucose 4,6-dehydratase n=1 Tax=Streptomyces sp. NPDC060184 TaxID=3347064 RepID=UPI00365F01C4
MADRGLSQYWEGRRVMITGYSGFIGSWLALTLRRFGAEVDGLALNADAATKQRHDWLTAHGVTGHVGNIVDYDAVSQALAGAPYDAVFHLAAQPLVRAGLEDPHGTLTTNVTGSINILEAARQHRPAVLVHVTSDKCYRNHGWPWPYRETDEIGGGCPYSVSKAAAEIIFEGYADLFEEAGPRAATVRFGNVIGGGDHADRRLVPDTLAALTANAPIELRNAAAVRPWQHVLDVVHGMLLLAQALSTGAVAPARVLNFAPPGDGATSRELASALATHWAATDQSDAVSVAALVRAQPDPGFAEEEVLRLDGRRAASELSWRHRLGLNEAAAEIVAWHRMLLDGLSADAATTTQIARYFDLEHQVSSNLAEECQT